MMASGKHSRKNNPLQRFAYAFYSVLKNFKFWFNFVIVNLLLQFKIAIMHIFLAN